jgi:hypothetical protein
MDIKSLCDVPSWEWPRDAGKVILKTLTEKGADQSDRLAAAELAGDLVVMNDQLAGALLAIVRSGDEPEDLRATAAIALGAVLEQADTELVDTNGFEDPEDVPISYSTFRNLQDSLRKLYFDETIAKEVRLRILEASVRAQQDWHPSVIKTAYSSRDEDWMLTAVFSMGYVRGFNDQILEALKSTNPEIHYEAVRAAGNWELDAAWPHVVALVNDPATPKPLLLAAIDAVASIRPREAGPILVDLADSDDEEIAEAADEAMGMARVMSSDPSDEEDEDENDWVN